MQKNTIIIQKPLLLAPRKDNTFLNPLEALLDFIISFAFVGSASQKWGISLSGNREGEISKARVVV